MPPAPNFVLTGSNTRPGITYTTTLELSTESAIITPFFVKSGDVTAIFHLDSLLEQHRRIFIRARLFDQNNVLVAETRQDYSVQGWVKLDEPGQQPLVILTTRTPRFAWSSPGITLLWQYDLSVVVTATGERITRFALNDTSFVFDSLEANTSYSWQVTARVQNSATEVTVKSMGTFVIMSATQPTFTLFYQNFPNPFGRGQRLPMTCFWFDLAHATTVQLTIYDLRLHQVRKIIPGAIGNGQLSVGAYGRQKIDVMTGCDPKLSWDGRDDRGNLVPPGVYVARFVADGKSTVIKMLYTGPP
jgi:hypothetical protein